MTDSTNVDALLRQAELQQKQIELNARFQQNMAGFKTLMPEIYNAYNNYRPKSLKLGLDPNHHINLLQQDSHGIYPGDPKTFCLQQAQEYIKSPGYFRISNNFFGDTQKESEGGNKVQLKQYDALLKAYESTTHTETTDPKDPIGIMMILGCGIGYHIEELHNKLNIYTLYIYEDNTDSFYASLYTINWHQILQHYKEHPNKGIFLTIGESAEQAALAIKKVGAAIGPHKTAKPYFYKHLNNNNIQELSGQLGHIMTYTTKAMKIFEQEISTLAANIDNYRQKPNILISVERSAEVPVFIVGNGPSLDELIPKLKENENNAVIISCGSALSTLYNNGIKPDFHVEIDYRRVIGELYNDYSSEDFRKGIALLASSKLHPDTLRLFEEVYLAQDNGDLGSELLRQYATTRNIKAITCANPTVTNAGLAFAISMNFKEIYLMGCDYGTAVEEQKHAKNSFHHKTNAKKDFITYDMKISIKGNHQATVFTDGALIMALENINALLLMNPSINCYNPNNGAYIQGAKSIKSSEINLNKNIQKEQAIKSIKEQSFHQLKVNKINPIKIEKKIRKQSRKIINFINKQDNPKNKEDILTNIDNIYREITSLSATDLITSHLLSGMIDIFIQLISVISLQKGQLEDSLNSYEIGKQSIINIIKENIVNIGEGKLIQLDDTHKHSMIN